MRKHNKTIVWKFVHLPFICKPLATFMASMSMPCVDVDDDIGRPSDKSNVVDGGDRAGFRTIIEINM